MKKLLKVLLIGILSLNFVGCQDNTNNKDNTINANKTNKVTYLSEVDLSADKFNEELTIEYTGDSVNKIYRTFTREYIYGITKDEVIQKYNNHISFLEDDENPYKGCTGYKHNHKILDGKLGYSCIEEYTVVEMNKDDFISSDDEGIKDIIIGNINILPCYNDDGTLSFSKVVSQIESYDDGLTKYVKQ